MASPKLNYVQLTKLREYASRLHFFMQLPMPLVDGLLAAMIPASLDTDALLFRQGDRADSLIIILAGSVALFSKQQNPGKRSSPTKPGIGKYICTLGPGDCIGAGALLHTRNPVRGAHRRDRSQLSNTGGGLEETFTRNVTVVCLEDTEIGTLSLDTYHKQLFLYKTQPHLFEASLMQTGKDKEWIAPGGPFAASLREATIPVPHGSSVGQAAAEHKQGHRPGILISGADADSSQDPSEITGEGQQGLKALSTIAEVQLVLKKPPKERSARDLQLMDQLLASFDFIGATLEPHVRVKLCRVLSFERIEAHQLVFSQGDAVADTSFVYFVLQGTLSQHVFDPSANFKSTEATAEAAMETDNAIRLDADLTALTTTAPHVPAATAKAKIPAGRHLREKYGKCVALACGGDMFGHTELLPALNRTGVEESEDDESKTKSHSRYSPLRKSSFIARQPVLLARVRFQQLVRCLDEQHRLLTLRDYRTLRGVLGKHSWNRTAEMVEEATDSVRHLKFFMHRPRRVITSICKALEYRKVQPNTVLFRQGDKDRMFFIIFSGEVDIHVLQNNERGQVSKDVLKMPWDDSDSDDEKRSREHTVVNSVEAMTNEEVEDCFGRKVLTLKPGDSFGQESIIKSLPRTATCICSVETELLCLSAEEFINIFGLQSVDSITHANEVVRVLSKEPVTRTREEIAATTQNLKSINFFHDMPNDIRRFVVQYMTVEPVEADTCVYQEGDRAEHMFIVMNGSVSVHRRPVAHSGDKNHERRNNSITHKQASHSHDSPKDISRMQGRGLVASPSHERERPSVMAHSAPNSPSGRFAGRSPRSMRGSRVVLGGSTDHGHGHRHATPRHNLKQRKGTIFTFAPSPTNSAPTSPQAERRSSLTSGRSSLASRASTGMTPADFKALVKQLYGDAEDILRTGSSFGAEDLENNSRRHVSIVTREASTFIVVSKITFLRAMRRMRKKSSAAKTDKDDAMVETEKKYADFLAQLAPFESVSPVQLLRLAYYIEERTYTRNQVLFRQGDHSSDVFVVVDGTCRLRQVVQLHAISPELREEAELARDLESSAMSDVGPELLQFYNSLARGEFVVVPQRQGEVFLRVGTPFFAQLSTSSKLAGSADIAAAKASGTDLVFDEPGSDSVGKVGHKSSPTLNIDMALVSKGELVGLEALVRAPRRLTAYAASDHLRVLVMKRRVFAQGELQRHNLSDLKMSFLQRERLYHKRMQSAVANLLHTKTGSDQPHRSLSATPSPATTPRASGSSHGLVRGDRGTAEANALSAPRSGKKRRGHSRQHSATSAISTSTAADGAIVITPAASLRPLTPPILPTSSPVHSPSASAHSRSRSGSAAASPYASPSHSIAQSPARVGQIAGAVKGMKEQELFPAEYDAEDAALASALSMPSKDDSDLTRRPEQEEQQDRKQLVQLLRAAAFISPHDRAIEEAEESAVIPGMDTPLALQFEVERHISPFKTQGHASDVAVQSAPSFMPGREKGDVTVRSGLSETALNASDLLRAGSAPPLDSLVSGPNMELPSFSRVGKVMDSKTGVSEQSQKLYNKYDQQHMKELTVAVRFLRSEALRKLSHTSDKTSKSRAAAIKRVLQMAGMSPTSIKPNSHVDPIERPSYGATRSSSELTKSLRLREEDQSVLPATRGGGGDTSAQHAVSPDAFDADAEWQSDVMQLRAATAAESHYGEVPPNEISFHNAGHAAHAKSMPRLSTAKFRRKLQLAESEREEREIRSRLRRCTSEAQIARRIRQIRSLPPMKAQSHAQLPSRKEFSRGGGGHASYDDVPSEHASRSGGGRNVETPSSYDYYADDAFDYEEHEFSQSVPGLHGARMPLHATVPQSDSLDALRARLFSADSEQRPVPQHRTPGKLQKLDRASVVRALKRTAKRSGRHGSSQGPEPSGSSKHRHQNRSLDVRLSTAHQRVGKDWHKRPAGGRVGGVLFRGPVTSAFLDYQLKSDGSEFLPEHLRKPVWK